MFQKLPKVGRSCHNMLQYSNWNINLWICELAKASNIKNCSVQLVCPAGLYTKLKCCIVAKSCENLQNMQLSTRARQINGLAGQTSSLYLKPWPVRIFKDWPFSLYVVSAFESDEGLVSYWTSITASRSFITNFCTHSADALR